MSQLGPFFVGERVPFEIAITDRVTGDPVDLTSYTSVKVMLRKDSASTNKFTTPADEDGTIRAGGLGIIDYTMPTAWVDADTGSWTLQVSFTTPAPAIPRKTEKITFRVEGALTPSA